MERGELKNLNDVVLFHGSLEELNSLDPEKQYEIAGKSFRSIQRWENGRPFLGILGGVETYIEDELFRRGYDGIIHKQTIPIDKVLWTYPIFRIEGTPIQRK